MSEKDIPRQLWLRQTLHMPNCLSMAYKNLLEGRNVMDKCLSHDQGSGPIGGVTAEETVSHFACRYGVSTCRIESLALDPVRAFNEISDDLLAVLTDGHVSLLDVPCGTGAVGASLLATIATLRTERVMPQQPLDVTIVGGDCAQTALDIYEQMMSQLRPTLEGVGVSVRMITRLWDGEKPDSTAALLDTLFEASYGDEDFLVIVANFSGHASVSFPHFERSFQHIYERFYGKPCTTIWVEPIMRKAERFLDKVRKLLESIPWFAGGQDGLMQHVYYWFHPFRKSRYRCTVMIHRYERS